MSRIESDINVVSFTGHLTKDPKAGYDVKIQSWVLKFKVAITAETGIGKSTIYQTCLTTGKTAEFISDNCKKGERLAILGKLAENNWTDNEGQFHKEQYVDVLEVTFMDRITKVTENLTEEADGEGKEKGEDKEVTERTVAEAEIEGETKEGGEQGN